MSEDRKDPSDCFWIDTRAMLSTKGNMYGVSVAIDLITVVWWPTKEAFVYDPDALAKKMAPILPGRKYTPALLRKHKTAASEFFTVLPDGRWAPSPKFFSITDGNAEQPTGH